MTRTATMADLPFIAEVYNSTIVGRAATADLLPLPLSHWEQWLAKHIPEKRPVLIAADNEGQRTGWLSFSDFYGRPAYEGTAELAVYVHPDHRRKGVASYLMDEALKLAPELGIHTLLAFIFKHNLPSVQLFAHFGFKDWGLLPEVAVLDNDAADLMIMGKKL